MADLGLYARGGQPSGAEGAVVATPRSALRLERRELLTRAGSGPAATTGASRRPGRSTRPADHEGRCHPTLAAAPRLALWRAPTDNDRIGGIAARWAELGLDRLDRRLVSAWSARAAPWW